MLFLPLVCGVLGNSLVGSKGLVTFKLTFSYVFSTIGGNNLGVTASPIRSIT